MKSAAITSPQAAPAKKTGFLKAFSAKNRFVLAVLIPTVVFYLLFAYLPILGSLAMSFTSVDTMLTQAIASVGLDNYIQALGDKLTWVSLQNSVGYALVTVPIGTVLSLFVALMLNSIMSLRAFFRTIYFIPVVTSMVACALVWRWMYQPAFGLFNQFLSWVHLPELKWLNDPNLALIAIVIMSIWKGLGFNVVIFLAGLSGIPRDYYEAASIDGANVWQNFTKITLPMLKATTAFVVITGAIGSLQVFTQMYIMTQGGPLDSTRTIVYVIYERAFVDYMGGYSATLAMILFIVIMIVSLFQLRMYRQDWEY
ncbi:MAG: sugar ABC transporter permease [Planctomycetes bacterium]|nr:sugar ABC transporter permease [Planctomycetota bacterium]